MRFLPITQGQVTGAASLTGKNRLPSLYLLCLAVLGDHKSLLGQPRDIASPVCPRSSWGALWCLLNTSHCTNSLVDLPLHPLPSLVNITWSNHTQCPTPPPGQGWSPPRGGSWSSFWQQTLPGIPSRPSQAFPLDPVGLSGIIPHHWSQVTTRWWSVDSSTLLFTWVLRTFSHKSDDTIWCVDSKKSGNLELRFGL